MVNTGFKKVICTGITIAFIATSIFSPGNLSAQPVSSSLPLMNIDVSKIIVNSGVASLEERFVAPEGPRGRTVIAIQNAHGIFDAQENIRALIQELQDQYNFNLVGLEGGAGKSDHTFLRTFPDKEVNRKVAESYMRRAELSGGEAAAILNPKPGIFYGVETPELYYVNRNSFLKAQGLKDANLHAINLFEKKLDKQREKIFPFELLEFHKAEQKYLSGKMPLWEFINILGGYNLSEQYPGVLAIYAAIAKARQAGRKAEEARQAEEAAAKVEGRVLFEEIKNLSDAIKSKFYAGNKEVADLDAVYQKLRVLRNLSSLEMTRAEYENYTAHQNEFQISGLELNLAPARQFYADAVKRDHAMYDNLMRDMKKENQNISIIVAGGFHTSGFAERLKKDGISFAVYSPRIHDMPKENKYLDVMEGKVSYIATIESPLPTMGLNKDGEAFVDDYAKAGIRLKQQAGANLSELERNWRDDIIRTEKNKSAFADPSPMIQRLEKIFRTFLSRASQILEELKNNYLSIAGAQAKNKVGEFVESERKRLEAVKPVETIKAASLGKHEQLLEEVAEISKAIKGFPVEHQLEFSNLFEEMAAKPGNRDLLKNLRVLSMGSGGIRHAEKIMLDAGVGRLDSVGILQEATNRRYQRSDFLADYEQLSGRENYGHHDMPYDQYLNAASPESVDIALTFAGIEVHGVPQELLQNGKSAEDILFETYRGLYSVLKPGGIILNFGYISRDLFPGDLKQKVEALGFDIQISGYKDSIVILRKKKSEAHPAVLPTLPSVPTAPEAAKGASLGSPKLDFLNDLVEKVKTASFSPTRDEEKFAELIEQAAEKPEFREAVKSLNVLALGSGGIRYAEGTFLDAGVGRLNSVGILRQDNRYGERDFFEGGIGGEFAGRGNYQHHESSYSEYLSAQKPGSVDFAFTFAGLEPNAIPEELLLRGAIDPEDYLLKTYRELYSVLAPGGVLLNFGFGPKDILSPDLKSKIEALGFIIETTGWANNIFILRKPADAKEISLGLAPGIKEFFTETEIITPEKAEQLADDGSTAGAEFSRNRTALASRFARKVYEEYLKQSGRETEIEKLPSAIILRENKLTYSLGRIFLHSYENAVDSYLERKRKTETAAKKPFTENLEIVYRLSRDGDFIVLEILDNGIGEVDKGKTFMKGYQSYPRYIGGQGMADRDIMENIWAMRASKRLMNRTDGPGAVLEIKIPTKTIEDYLGQAMGKSLGGMRHADLETSKKLAASVLEALRDPDQKIRALSVYLPAEERKIRKKWEKFLDNDTKEFMISKLNAEGKPDGLITHLALNKYGEAYVMQIESRHLGKKQKGGAKFINPQHNAALLLPILDVLETKLSRGEILPWNVPDGEPALPEEGLPLGEFLRNFRAEISPPIAPAILPVLPPSTAPEASQGASLGLANLKKKFPKFTPAFDHPDFISVYGILENSAIGSQRLEKYFGELVMQFAILFQSMKPETARKILKYIQPDGSLDLNRLIDDAGIVPVYERSGFAADNAISQLTKQLGLSSSHYEIVDSARSAKGRADMIVFSFEDVTAPQYSKNEKIYLPLEPFKYVKRGLVVAPERRGAKRLLGLDPSRTVIVVSSPSDRQVRQMLDAYKKYEKGKRPLLILGLPQAQTLMAANIQKEYGFDTVSRTDKSVSRSNLGSHEVVVLNTSGELVDFMRAADVVIVGSNRNVFEPVSLGIPTLYFTGDWFANQIGRDVTTRAGAAKPVDLENIKLQIDSILEDPHPMISASGMAVKDFEDNVIPAGRLYGSLATAAAILDRASGRSLGEKSKREEVGEDEVYALAPEDYWKDPAFRGQFFEKQVANEVLMRELQQRGVQINAEIRSLLGKIRFYQAGQNSALAPYQLDVLAALLKKGFGSDEYRIFTVLKKKGIDQEKVKAINLHSINLLSQVDVGRSKGQHRDVVRVMVETKDGTPFDFAAAVDRVRAKDNFYNNWRRHIDEFFGMRDKDTFYEYEALSRDSAKTDLLPKPYLITTAGTALILFKEYIPGIDLEDWFDRIRRNIIKNKKSVPSRTVEKVMFQIGRLFGEYYVKTGMWPEDMHFGNIIIHAEKGKKTVLRIADYMGGSNQVDEIAFRFEELVEHAARGALLQFEESDFPTEDPRFLMYLLAGFESVFADPNDAIDFFIRIMPNMNRAPDAYAKRMLDRFLLRDHRVLIDPSWGTGPVQASSLGASQKMPDELTPEDIPELIQALAYPHALTVYTARTKLFKSGAAAIPYLLKAMEDENPSIRQGSVYATLVILSGLKEDPENMAEIIKSISAVAVRDSNSRVREIAWKALDQLSLVYSHLISAGIRLKLAFRRISKNLKIPFSWKALKESFSPSFWEAIQKRFVVSRTLRRVLVTNPDGFFEKSVRNALTRFLLLLDEKTRAGFISAISNKGGKGAVEILLNLIPETQTAEGMQSVLGGLGRRNMKQLVPQAFQALPADEQRKIQSSTARFMDSLMAEAVKTIENPALTRDLIAQKEILLGALWSSFVIRGEPEMGRTSIRAYALEKGVDWAALSRSEKRSLAREFYFNQMRLVADLIVQMKDFISKNPDAGYETIKTAVLDPSAERLTPTQRFRFMAGILNYIHQHLRIENIRKAAFESGVESDVEYSGSNLSEPQKAFFKKLMGFVPETAVIHFYPDYLYVQLDDAAYVHFLYLVDDDVIFEGRPDQFNEMPVFEQSLYAHGVAVNAFGEVMEFNGLPLPSFGLESKTGGQKYGTKNTIRHERQHHFFLLYGGEEIENYYAVSPQSALPVEERLLKPILLNAQNEMIARVIDGRAQNMDREEVQKWFDRYWSSQFLETVRNILEEIPAGREKTELLNRVRERAQEITQQGFEKIRELLRAKSEELKSAQPGLSPEEIREKSEDWTAAYLQTLPLSKIERLTALMEGAQAVEEVSGASLGEAAPYRFPDKLPQGYAQDLRERLRAAVDEVIRQNPGIDQLGFFSIGAVFSEKYPELYSEASEWFGQSPDDMSGLVRYLGFLYQTPKKSNLKYVNPEVLDELTRRIRSTPGRWLIVIDGFAGAGKTRLFNGIQKREFPVSEFFEEMEFVEGDTHLDTWMQQIMNDPDLPANVRGGREKNPAVLEEWAVKMDAKHPRPIGLEGPRIQQIRQMFDRTGGAYGQYKRFLANTHSRIVVFNMLRSFDLMEKEIERDKNFPAFHVAKINVIPESGLYHREGVSRKLEITYSEIDIPEARKRELSRDVNNLFGHLFTIVLPKINDFQLTENDLLDQLQALRVERKNSRTTSLNQLDMAIVDAFKKAGLMDAERFTNAEAEYVVRMAAKNFRDAQGRSLGQSSPEELLKYDGWVRAGFRDLFQEAVGEGALELQSSNYQQLYQLIHEMNRKYKNVLSTMNTLVLGSGSYLISEEILLEAGAAKVVSVGIRRQSSGYAEDREFNIWMQKYKPDPKRFENVDATYEKYLAAVPDGSIDLVITHGGLEKAGIPKELMLRDPPKTRVQYLKEIYELLYRKLSPGAIIINYGYGGVPDGDESGDDKIIPDALRPDLLAMGYEIQTSNKSLTAVLRKPEQAAVGASLGLHIANAGSLAREELTKRLGPELLEAMKEANGGRPVVPLYFSGSYEDILMGDKESDAPSLRRMLSRIPDSEMTALIIDSKFGARTDHIILVDTAENFRAALPMMDFYLRGQETQPAGGFKFKSNLGIEQFEFVFHASAFQENSALGAKMVHMNIISLGKEKFLPLRRQGLMSEAVSSMEYELSLRYANWPVSTEARNAAAVHWFKEYALDSRFATSGEDFQSVKPFISSDLASVRRVVESYRKGGASREASSVIYDGLPMIGKIPEYLLAINFEDLASAPRPFEGMDVEAMAKETAVRSNEDAMLSRWNVLIQTAEVWQFNPNKISDEEIEALKLGFKLLINDAEGGDFTTGDLGQMARARIMTRTYMRSLVGDKPQTAEVLREAKKLFLNSKLYRDHRREKELVGILTQADSFLTLAIEGDDPEMAKNVKNELELITAGELEKFHSPIARSYLNLSKRLEKFGLSLSLVAVAQSKLAPPITGLSPAKGASLGAVDQALRDLADFDLSEIDDLDKNSTFSKLLEERFKSVRGKDWAPAGRSPPQSILLSGILELMARKIEIVPDPPAAVTGTPLGDIDLSKLNDASRYTGYDAAAQIARDLTLAHYLGLIKIRSLRGAIGPRKVHLYLKALLDKNETINISTTLTDWLKIKHAALKMDASGAKYRGDDGQIAFYEEVFGTGEAIEGKHLGGFFKSVPPDIRARLGWSMINLNYSDTKKIRAAFASLTPEQKKRLKGDDGQISFYESIFRTGVADKNLGALFTALPARAAREMEWSFLNLNYKDENALYSAFEHMPEAQKDNFMGDEGQIAFYEMIFGGDVQDKHLSALFSVFSPEAKKRMNWTMIRLNYAEVKKIRDAFEGLSEDERKSLKGDQGQLKFYQRVFGRELEEKFLANLYSALPRGTAKEMGWSYIFMNYGDVSRLNQAALARLEELKTTANSLAGQQAFYRQILGDEKAARLDTRGAYVSLSPEVHRAMTNWQKRFDGTTSDEARVPKGFAAGASLGAGQESQQKRKMSRKLKLGILFFVISPFLIPAFMMLQPSGRIYLRGAAARFLGTWGGRLPVENSKVYQWIIANLAQIAERDPQEAARIAIKLLRNRDISEKLELEILKYPGKGDATEILPLLMDVIDERKIGVDPLARSHYWKALADLFTESLMRRSVNELSDQEMRRMLEKVLFHPGMNSLSQSQETDIRLRALQNLHWEVFASGAFEDINLALQEVSLYSRANKADKRNTAVQEIHDAFNSKSADMTLLIEKMIRDKDLLGLRNLAKALDLLNDQFRVAIIFIEVDPQKQFPAAELKKESDFFKEAEQKVTEAIKKIEGRSLGTMKTEIPTPPAPPLDDDELRYLAFKLGFVKFADNQDEFEKRVRAKISAENIRSIGDQLYEYIMKKSAEEFEAQSAEIEDFIRSLQKSTDQELVQRTEAVVDRLLSSMSDSVKAALRPELIKSFTSTLREISKRVTMTEAGVVQTGEAQKLYQAATLTNEDQVKMKAAETILLKRLREATSKLMKPNEKTVIVTHPLSLPETSEEIAGMFQSAFAAAPNDALLGRPLLKIVVIVTDENGRAVRDYAAQSPFAANIEVKRAAPADLARVFEGFQKRAKTDNLIFLLPNAKMATRESRVIQHQDSAVPNDLSFVKDALAEAAVGLARALKLPEGSRERENYLAFLSDELGITYKQDPESRKIIISLDLKAFIENLVEIARAQRVTAIAA